VYLRPRFEAIRFEAIRFEAIGVDTNEVEIIGFDTIVRHHSGLSERPLGAAEKVRKRSAWIMSRIFFALVLASRVASLDLPARVD
jgi:hypothetical protein